MERKKQRISDLFYDNRFLIAFSVLFAIIAWLIVATEFSETETTIHDVPVEIKLSNINYSGLKRVDEEVHLVKVTIKGKRYIVESEDIKDDILAVADTSLVSSKGEHTLNVTVTSKSVRPEYQFVSVTPHELNVTFDYQKEAEFKIEPYIIFKGQAVRDGYFMGEPTVSDVTSKVIVSGPETAFKKVVRVVAKAEIDGDLYKTTPVPADLIPVNKDGEEVKGVKIESDPGTVDVIIPVYYKKELPVTCNFTNIPTEYIGNIPFEYTVYPSKATFAVYDQNFEGDSIELSTKIDFSELHAGKNEINIDVSENEFSGVVLLDENISRFVVTVNVPEVSQKKFTISPENIEIRNLPEDIEVDFLNFKFSELIVFGQADKLEQLDNENIVVVADFLEIDESELKDTVSVPIKFSDGYCWSYGEYYADYIVK